MTRTERLHAAQMIADHMRNNTIARVEDLPEDLRALAETICPRRKHGPAKPKRGRGMHSNDMFRGF